MAGFWNWLLGKAGLGPSEEERLDKAAAQMEKEVSLHKELAAKTLALSRTKQRELAEEVAKYRNLESAAVRLEKQGNSQAVEIIAIQMAEGKAKIEAMTTELEQLNASSQDAVDKYRVEKDEAQKLLSQHGRLKAVAQMNRDLGNLQREMRAIAGASTAKGAYQVIAREIDTRTQEFRALAQLESGDASQKAMVNNALKEVEVQGILEDIRQKALEGVIDAESTSTLILDRAIDALKQDPLQPMLSLPTTSEKQEPGESSENS